MKTEEQIESKIETLVEAEFKRLTHLYSVPNSHVTILKAILRDALHLPLGCTEIQYSTYAGDDTDRIDFSKPRFAIDSLEDALKETSRLGYSAESIIESYAVLRSEFILYEGFSKNLFEEEFLFLEDDLKMANAALLNCLDENKEQLLTNGKLKHELGSKFREAGAFIGCIYPWGRYKSEFPKEIRKPIFEIKQLTFQLIARSFRGEIGTEEMINQVADAVCEHLSEELFQVCIFQDVSYAPRTLVDPNENYSGGLLNIFEWVAHCVVENDIKFKHQHLQNLNSFLEKYKLTGKPKNILHLAPDAARELIGIFEAYLISKELYDKKRQRIRDAFELPLRNAYQVQSFPLPIIEHIREDYLNLNLITFDTAYRDVLYRGARFELTPKEGQILKIFHEAWKNGDRFLSEETIFKKNIKFSGIIQETDLNKYLKQTTGYKKPPEETFVGNIIEKQGIKIWRLV